MKNILGGGSRYATDFDQVFSTEKLIELFSINSHPCSNLEGLASATHLSIHSWSGKLNRNIDLI